MNATQLEFQQQGRGNSQVGRTLALLRARFDQWVAMPELESVSGSSRMNSRIADVRRLVSKEGLIVLNKTDWVDGVCHSFYKLTTNQPNERLQ